MQLLLASGRAILCTWNYIIVSRSCAPHWLTKPEAQILSAVAQALLPKWWLREAARLPTSLAQEAGTGRLRAGHSFSQLQLRQFCSSSGPAKLQEAMGILGYLRKLQGAQAFSPGWGCILHAALPHTLPELLHFGAIWRQGPQGHNVLWVP